VRRNADLFEGGVLPEHLWIGASIENQEAVYRIAQLREVPATVRFLSCEPLLGPVKLDLDGLDWVIVGGESGIGYRPMKLDWARDIRDQCLSAGVAFFFKQVGGRTPKAGGRLLDGLVWDDYPNLVSASR
jgi:protein gp37